MVLKDRQNPSHVLSIILAGGAGKRLFPLTQDRSKPAVPLGGKYRLIDVPISNCLNSGLKKIFILTQFNSASLNHHITNSYRFDPFAEGFAEVLAAEQTMTNPNWFQGTADAVRQHLHRFTGREDDYQLILSGDQLYRMNYQRVLESHWRHGADVTICVIPKSEAVASSFGLLKLASDGRIEQFREKPKGDALHEMRTDTTPLGLSAEQAAERPYLASMGIYLFKRSVLIDLLADASMIDFGYQVIPRAIEKYDVYGFLFDDYWEDLGTVEAFYKANIDLTSSDPHFDFHDMTAPIYTRAGEDRRRHVVKIEVRVAARKVDVGFVKRFDGSEIFPIIVEQESIDIVFLNCTRYDLVSKIDHRRISQQIDQDASLEQVDAHRCKIRALGGLLGAESERCCVRAHFVQRIALGFFAKLFDPAIRCKLQQPEA